MARDVGEVLKSLVEQEWEKNPRAMYEAHRESWRIANVELAAQLQAAQAKLADVLKITPTWYRGMYGCPDDMIALTELRRFISPPVTLTENGENTHG